MAADPDPLGRDLNRMRPRTVAQGETYPKLGADSGRRRVSVDRPDPADDPEEPGHRRPPDDPRSLDAAPLRPPDPPDRETILAYRALADRAHAAHREGTRNGTHDAAADADRDSWAEALPSLRVSWQEHENRYPERERATPRTHPDGSWSSGETRTLTPEQNTEATKACADIHDEGERVALPMMLQIEAANPNRRLAGLDHMLKGEDRLKEKIAERLRYNPDLSLRQAAAEVPDAVRFTLAYSESHYTDGVLADVERLQGAGCELLKLKNLWAKDQYKGVNSQWFRPDTGLRFEVQFHTPQSREAKELTHQAYERLRDPLTSKAEETQLEAYQRRVNAFVERPPDVFRIEDYPPEKRDG
jgi:hypothetical protein